MRDKEKANNEREDDQTFHFGACRQASIREEKYYSTQKERETHGRSKN